MKSILLIFIIYLLAIQCQGKTYDKEYQKKWEWTSDSTHYHKQGNTIHTGHYVTSYVNFANGVEIKNDGTMWNVDVFEHDLDTNASAYFCMGITPVAEIGLRYDSSQFNYFIGACSNGNTYDYASSTHTVINPMVNTGRQLKKTKWDIILESNKLIVTNEEYDGGNSRIEWDIDSALEYIPFYFSYGYITYRTNTCNHRCDSCPDFDYESCTICISTPNILDAPSCQCKSGFTDLYDQKLNLACQADTKQYFYPKQRDWKWNYGTSNRADGVDLYTHDGKLSNHKISTYSYIRVDLENGMEPKLDGYRWHIKILEETDATSYYPCFGVSNIDNMTVNQGVSKHNIYCTDGNYYGNDAIRIRDYGTKKVNYTYLRRGTTWEITFDATNKYLTISEVRFGGKQHYEMDLDRSIKYMPYIYFRGASTQNIILQINTCVARCQDCKFMEPYSCTGCQDSNNRNPAPDCECKDGLQDTYRQPDKHYVQEECIPEYEYKDLKPPEFTWKTESPVVMQDDFDLYGINTSKYLNIKGDVDPLTGLVVEKDGLRWQVRVTDHGNYYICFGVQKTERLYLYRNSWHTDQGNMCGICTDRTLRETDCVSKKQIGAKILPDSLGIGQTYDMIYNYGLLVITNQRYGGDVYYEFLLKEELNYVPHIYMYNTNTGFIKNEVQLKTCSHRCESCTDWIPEQCIICSDANNRESAPFCKCKEGFEDYYDHKYHKTCRQKISWKEPSPPEWVWDSESPIYIKEEYGKEGLFEVDYNRRASIWLKDKNLLEDKTKWTIKVLEYTKGHICFGIQQYYKTLASTNHNTYYNTIVAICTINNTHYSDGAISMVTKTQMPGVNQEAYNTYDLYYQKDKFVITNKDFGGDFYIEWELDPYYYFTPHISKREEGGSLGQSMTFQVKACNYKCESCVDWQPTQCLTCANPENRKDAPGCECLDNYEDFYDHRNQKVCRKIPNYKKPSPPDWIFHSESVYITEQKESKKFGTYYNNNFSYYGTVMLQDLNKVEDQTEWEVKILNHPSGTTGHICIGVIELGRVLSWNWNHYTYNSQSSSFCSDNNQYNADGVNGADSKTKILYPMPNHTRDLLTGTTFKIRFKNDFMNISNIESGGNASADFELKPYLNYTPYIYFHQDVQIQVKACSHRCAQCVDYEPTQCTICSDQFNRQDAPACYCKKGFYDTYDHKDNVKCIPLPTYNEYTYPQWQWFTESNQAFLDDPLQQGVYSNRGGYANFFLKDYLILQNKTKWTVNILHHNSANYICVGVIKAENIEITHFNTSWYNRSTVYCTDHGVYKYGARDYRVYSHVYHPRQNISGLIDIIYENNLLTVTSKNYGGEIEVEFDLYENVNYTPVVTMYDASIDLNDQEVQFQQCNLKCKTCVKWKPEVCEVCQGTNRLVPPNCQCKPGYIDFYKNQYNVDCILEPNTAVPLAWQWTTQSTQIDQLPDKSWDIYGNSRYGYIYVDLGRDGIPTITEGLKWSVKLEKLTTNSSWMCIGIMRVEQLDQTIQNPDASVYDKITGACSNKVTHKYASIDKVIFEDWKTGVDNEGMTFDLIYRDNYLSISSIPYSGTAFAEFYLNPGQKYVPVVSYYKYSSYPLVFNLTPCAYQCGQCDISISKDTCTYCRDALQRTEAPQCACQYGFFDNGTPVCQPCEFPCKSCTSRDLCSTCVAQPNRLNNPPYCSCYDKHFQNEDLECVACAYWCDSCKETFDSCVTCKVEPGRKTDPLDCSCIDGYFEDPQSKSCQKCPDYCSTCSNGSGSCNECVSSQVMVDGVCSCASTSFAFDGGCIACTNPCLKCESYTTCTECRYPGAYRLDVPSCECEEGYYEDASYTCQPCMDGCAKCSQFATNCEACKVDDNRNQDPTNCTCNEGYFDDPQTGECKINECPEKCGGDCVVGSSTQCNSCAIGPYNRSTIADNCDCADGFYEVGQLECAACNPQCGTCTDTSGCLTCASFGNRGGAPLCQCNNGYFENGQGSCEQCHYKCASCSEQDTCIQCANDPNRNSSGNCSCKVGYTEDPVTQSCAPANPCDLKCGTCESTNYSKCLSCKQGNLFRQGIDENCACMDGYYDDGVSEECQPCQFPCQNCSGPTQCLTCAIYGQNRDDAPNCTCSSGFIQDSDSSCISATGCKIEVGRYQDGDCLCKPGFYEDVDANTCPKCPSQCKTCSSATECVVCSLGYRQDSAPVCELCPRKCGDCDSNGCLTCNFNRDDSTSDCLCKLGFYDDGSSRDCKRCAAKCSTCENDPQNCTTCASMDEGRGPAPQCACKAGYFDNNGACEKCALGCLTCKDRADNCLICNFGTKRSKVAPDCACEIGYYESHFSPNCQPCTTECINRDNETGKYTTSTGSTYQFGSPEQNTKQDYEQGKLPEEPNTIPDDYVDDGEGNLVPATYYEELLVEKEKEKVQEAIEQEKAKAEEAQQIIEEQEQQKEAVEQVVQQQEQEVQQAEEVITQKEAEKEAEQQKIVQKEQEKTQAEADLAQKEAEIANKEAEIATKQANGEDTTALEAELATLETEEQTLNDKIADVSIEITESQDKITEIEEVIQEKEIIKESAEEVLQEKQQELEQIQETIKEKEKEVQEVQQKIQEKEEEIEQIEENSGSSGNDNSNGGDNGGDNNGNSQETTKTSFSVNVSSGNQTNNCEGPCEDCQPQKPRECTVCKQGLQRLNNPPLCDCAIGYYGVDTNNNCQPCPEKCLNCQNFNLCTDCPLDSNRQVDPLTGMCECIPGYTESRLGLQCQRCYTFNGVCYQQCPKNTVLDDLTFNCVEFKQSLIDIKSTIVLYGFLAFLAQFVIFYIFVKISKRKFEKSYGLAPKPQVHEIYELDQDSQEDEVSSDEKLNSQLFKSNEEVIQDTQIGNSQQTKVQEDDKKSENLFTSNVEKNQ